MQTNFAHHIIRYYKNKKHLLIVPKFLLLFPYEFFSGIDFQIYNSCDFIYFNIKI
jgi:hypothetical protein